MFHNFDKNLNKKSLVSIAFYDNFRSYLIFSKKKNKQYIPCE